MTTAPIPVVFIPALLCDEALYRDVITDLGEAVQARVVLSPKPRLADSVTDILSRAPATFALVGTSYGGNLALEVALAAPQRVTALWLMGCNAAPAPTMIASTCGLATRPNLFSMLVFTFLSPVLSRPIAERPPRCAPKLPERLSTFLMVPNSYYSASQPRARARRS